MSIPAIVLEQIYDHFLRLGGSYDMDFSVERKERYENCTKKGGGEKGGRERERGRERESKHTASMGWVL